MILPSEYLLRLIIKDWVKRNGSFSSKSFTPQPKDIDGISLYRESLLSATDLAASVVRRRGDHFVAAVLVAELAALGLTVVETPGDLPGHVVIPQLIWGADPAVMSDLAKSLVDIAVRNIRVRPV